MPEQQSGLRFDIYERVHLADGNAGIQDLDEIELVPQIQVDTQADQTVLKGSLLLAGVYRGEQNTGPHTLHHRIPVEITLPVNRIHRDRDISVEIENFDIDLLSSRSLNVTGVLSLRGLEMISQPEETAWQEEEETVFVHRAEPEAVEEAPQAPQMVRNEPHAEAAQSPPAAPVQEQAELASTESVVPPHAEVAQEPEEPAVESIVFSEEAVVASVQEEDTAEADALQKKEVKIAFGSKKTEEAASSGQSQFKTMLNKMLKNDSSTRQEAAKPDEASETREQSGAADVLEWQKLFLGASSGEGEFRRVRMCIVQKEETIDMIAERYQLNPREIVLYNRLGDSPVNAGQIIYIPK